MTLAETLTALQEKTELKGATFRPKLWLPILERMTDEKARDAAVGYCVYELPYVPDPANAWTRYQEITSKEQVPWTEAYEAACRARREVGSAVEPQFSDPRVNWAIDCLGGWTVFCQTYTEDMATERAQFRMAWESNLQADGKRELMQLSGRNPAGALPEPGPVPALNERTPR